MSTRPERCGAVLGAAGLDNRRDGSHAAGHAELAGQGASGARIVRIVERFGVDAPALAVSEIARRADLHVATASRLVDELVGHGWLRRDGDRAVRVGVRLWEVASRASPTSGLREAAMPFLEDVHAVVGHHVQLGVRDGDEVLFVERLSARGAVGIRSRAHRAGAAGGADRTRC